MQTYAELMAILKANEIRYSHYTKSKLTDLLVKRELIPEKHGKNKHEKAKKDIDPKHNFLRRYAAIQRRLRYMIWKQIRLFFILLYTGCFGLGSKFRNNWYV